MHIITVTHDLHHSQYLEDYVACHWYKVSEEDPVWCCTPAMPAGMRDKCASFFSLSGTHARTHTLSHCFLCFSFRALPRCAVRKRFEEFKRPSAHMEVGDLVDWEELDHFRELHRAALQGDQEF